MAGLLRKDRASTISPSDQAALQANTTGPSRKPLCPGEFISSVRTPQLFQGERVLRGVKAEDRVEQGRGVGQGSSPRTWRVTRARKFLVP